MIFLSVEAKPVEIPPVLPIQRVVPAEPAEGSVWECTATHYGTSRNTTSTGPEGSYGMLVVETTIPQSPIRTLLPRVNTIASNVPGTTDSSGRLRNTSVEVCQYVGGDSRARAMQAKVRRIRVFQHAQQ